MSCLANTLLAKARLKLFVFAVAAIFVMRLVKSESLHACSNNTRLDPFLQATCLNIPTYYVLTA